MVEVARWLKAEREPAPAIMMVAARLGYIAEGPVPTIDPAFPVRTDGHATASGVCRRATKSGIEDSRKRGTNCAKSAT